MDIHVLYHSSYIDYISIISNTNLETLLFEGLFNLPLFGGCRVASANLFRYDVSIAHGNKVPQILHCNHLRFKETSVLASKN
jgi:hypothetical protein